MTAPYIHLSEKIRLNIVHGLHLVQVQLHHPIDMFLVVETSHLVIHLLLHLLVVVAQLGSDGHLANLAVILVNVKDFVFDGDRAVGFDVEGLFLLDASFADLLFFGAFVVVDDDGGLLSAEERAKTIVFGLEPAHLKLVLDELLLEILDTKRVGEKGNRTMGFGEMMEVRAGFTMRMRN